MDKYTKKSMDTYNSKASDYRNTRDYIVTKELKDKFIEYLGEQNINHTYLLDMACGMGDLLHELYEKYEIIGTGIDIANNMIKKATDLYGDHLKFLNTNAENVLIENNTQDIVTICCAFHHLSNPKKVMLEVDRILKKNGYFYIADFTMPFILNVIGNIIYPLLSSGDVRMYNKKDLESLCTNTNFILEEYNRIDKLSYIAKLKKKV